MLGNSRRVFSGSVPSSEAVGISVGYFGGHLWTARSLLGVGGSPSVPDVFPAATIGLCPGLLALFGVGVWAASAAPQTQTSPNLPFLFLFLFVVVFAFFKIVLGQYLASECARVAVSGGQRFALGQYGSKQSSGGRTPNLVLLNDDFIYPTHYP